METEEIEEDHPPPPCSSSDLNVYIQACEAKGAMVKVISHDAEAPLCQYYTVSPPQSGDENCGDKWPTSKLWIPSICSAEGKSAKTNHKTYMEAAARIFQRYPLTSRAQIVEHSVINCAGSSTYWVFYTYEVASHQLIRWAYPFLWKKQEIRHLPLPCRAGQ